MTKPEYARRIMELEDALKVMQGERESQRQHEIRMNLLQAAAVIFSGHEQWTEQLAVETAMELLREVKKLEI